VAVLASSLEALLGTLRASLVASGTGKEEPEEEEGKWLWRLVRIAESWIGGASRAIGGVYGEGWSSQRCCSLVVTALWQTGVLLR
jgi:hypothetical protein